MGQTVIEPQFDEVLRFTEGLAAVKLGRKWGFISRMGQMMIKPQFDKAIRFSEGLAAVQIDGQWGFIDRTGKIIVKPQFKSANGLFRRASMGKNQP